jgi:hypothetical protein
MYELFYKYLILNGKNSLQGIGSFSVEQLPATMDLENKRLIPPSQNISIDSENVNSEDHYFVNYVSREMNITEDEAAKKFSEFASDMQKQVVNNGSVVMPGIGRLKKDFMGSYTIEPENESKQVLPDLWITKTQAANTGLLDVYQSGQPSIIRTNTQYKENDRLVIKEREDYWWVIAIVLAIMGLGALLFYYM